MIDFVCGLPGGGGGLTTVQVNWTEPALLTGRAAATVTVAACAVVGVPVITPVAGLIASPTREVRGAVGQSAAPESVAPTCSATGCPTVVVCHPDCRRRR